LIAISLTDITTSERARCTGSIQTFLVSAEFLHLPKKGATQGRRTPLAVFKQRSKPRRSVEVIAASRNSMRAKCAAKQDERVLQCFNVVGHSCAE
jgi:hypothetical protein